MSQRRELTDLLEQVPLLSRCSRRERATVARFMETADLPAGTDLIVEGEAGDALFVIIDGEAAIRRALGPWIAERGTIEPPGTLDGGDVLRIDMGRASLSTVNVDMGRGTLERVDIANGSVGTLEATRYAVGVRNDVRLPGPRGC